MYYLYYICFGNIETCGNDETWRVWTETALKTPVACFTKEAKHILAKSKFDGDLGKLVLISLSKIGHKQPEIVGTIYVSFDTFFFW